MPDQLDTFIRNTTAPGTAAIVIPLYGFWSDVKDNPVNGEVLNAAMLNARARLHNYVYIFVANAETIPNNPKDPDSVGNILRSYERAGNALMIPVGRDATYTDYLREGINAALKETKAQFILTLNPWTLIQDSAVDIIIDRVNRMDDAKIVSGADMSKKLGVENFRNYHVNAPTEHRDITFDFLVVPRFAAETISFDANYKTHWWMQLDVFQAMRRKGWEVIVSDIAPIFVFDFPWKEFEAKEDFEADRAYFANKWKFNLDMDYEAL
jgi:hypothetical protein